MRTKGFVRGNPNPSHIGVRVPSTESALGSICVPHSMSELIEDHYVRCQLLYA